MPGLFSLLQGRLATSLVLILLLMGCGKDQPEDQGPSLEGRWEIERALRNGRAAESLADLFFQFGPEQNFVTNISGSTETGSYQIEADQIMTEGVSMALTYTQVELNERTLYLKSKVGNYRFEFFLRRAADQKEESVPM